MLWGKLVAKRAKKSRAEKPKKRVPRPRPSVSETSGTLFDEADRDVLNRIFSAVYTQTQIDPSQYKLTTVYRRIQRQMILHKFRKLEDYASYLEAKPEEVKILCEDLFIHVTEFFRDADSFEALNQQILPRLSADKTVKTPLRLWVPGCS